MREHLTWFLEVAYYRYWKLEKTFSENDIDQ